MVDLQSEIQSREALNSVPIGIVILRDDFSVVHWNACLEEWTGIDASEMLGTNVVTRFPDFARPDVAGRIKTVFTGSPPVVLSSQLHRSIIPRRDQEKSFQEVMVTGLPATDGDGFFAMFAIQDVTSLATRVRGYWEINRRLQHEAAQRTMEIAERKKAEQALRESQERFDLAIQGSADGLWDRMDVNEPTEWWSPRYYELLGYEPGEIEPSTSTFRQLLHPDDLQRMLEAVKSHFEQDVRYDVEYRLRTKSGKYRWFRARAAVLRNEIGQPVRMTGCIEDIEDRKRAEEELRIKDHAIHSAITGVAFCDLEGTISYANPAFAKMFGYDHAGEVVGLMKTELVSVESSMIDIISIVKARGFWQGENIGKKKDDTLFPIELAVSLINDADGKPLGMVGTFLDISRRRQAERLASIGTLAAGIAHEINNPLGAMLLTAEYALGKLDDRTVIEDSLENILSQIDRCAQVVRSVLQFSRDGYSKKSRHDLIEVLRRAIDLSRQQVQQAGVQIDLETNLRECFVALNPLEIEQVFVNLIVNAVQSSNRGDRVVVKLEHDNNRARVVVEDQGAGMPAEIRARVFDPFFSTRLHSGGTGLGLSIVHGIVRDHDGNIDVWSEPDRGTRMTVTLPTVQPRQFDAQSACC